MQMPVLRQHHKRHQIRHILQGSRFEVRRFSISAPSLTLTSPQAEPPFVQKLRSDSDTVRQYRPPGAVRGAPGNRRPYLDKKRPRTPLLSSALLPSRRWKPKLARGGLPFQVFRSGAGDPDRAARRRG
jgi:hypothetical protein